MRMKSSFQAVAFVTVLLTILAFVYGQPLKQKKFMLHNRPRNVVLTVLANGTVVSKQESDELKYSTIHENAWFTPCNICAEIKENSTFELCQVRTDSMQKKLVWERNHNRRGRVIVTEYEPPRNHVVLKATIYSLGESGSAEGASLYVKHEREEDEEYERALFVMPHRSLPGSVTYIIPENSEDVNGVQLHLKNVIEI